MPTKIEWCTETWQATKGCSYVSAGCANCYAQRMARRQAAMAEASRVAGRSHHKQVQYGQVIGSDGKWNGKIVLCEDALTEPLKWKKPRLVFVDSMSDLFHPGVPFDFLDKAFAVMSLCPEHTFQILTKRPERRAEYLASVEGIKQDSERAIALWDAWGAIYGDRENWRPQWPLPNVWLGTSAEDRPSLDERLPWLLKCPAAVRFLSLEPLLAPFDSALLDALGIVRALGINSGGGEWGPEYIRDGTKTSSIDWVIVGGETGPGARPCDIENVRRIGEQCRAARVPWFFKQWGSNPWAGGKPVTLRSRTGRDMDEWPEDLRVREWPAGVTRGQGDKGTK